MPNLSHFHFPITENRPECVGKYDIHALAGKCVITILPFKSKYFLLFLHQL